MESRASVDSRRSGPERNTRRRRSSFSPEQRGRRNEGREGSAKERSRSGIRQDKRAPRRMSPSPSRSRSRSQDRMDTAEDRARRAVTRSPSRSPVQRGGRSPSPFSKRRAARRSPSPPRDRLEGHAGDSCRDGGRNRFDDRPAERPGRNDPPPPPARQPPPPVPRERSLSPFSKRVALTRAMNGGR